MSMRFRRSGGVLSGVVVATAATVALLAGALIASGLGRTGEDGDGWDVYFEVVRLRTEQHDCAAARDLAATFLTGYVEHDVLRQLVHYEHASALRCLGQLAEALADFERVATEYPGLELPLDDEYCKTDDAEFFVGIVTQQLGDVDQAVAILTDLFQNLPTSNRAVPAAKWSIYFLARQERTLWAEVRQGHLTPEEVDNEPSIRPLALRCIAEHAGDSATASVIYEYITYLIDKGIDMATPPVVVEGRIAALANQAATMFPEDVWTTRCLLRVSHVRRHFDLDGALLIVGQAIAAADASGDEGLRFDSRLDRARFLADAQRYDEAYAAYIDVYQTMPAGERTAAALMEANNVLFWQEHSSCFSPDEPVRPAAAFDHSALIRQNLDLLLAENATTPACIEALAKYAEYLLDRAWRGGIDGPPLEAEMQWVVDHLQQLAPEAEKTLYVHMQLAQAVGRFDTDRAVQQLQPLIQEAEMRGLARCRLDGSLAQAHILASAGLGVEARTIWQDELARGLAPWEPGSLIARQLEAELRNFIAHTYVLVEHDSERAIADFDSIAATDRFPDDWRAISLYHKAWELGRLNREAEIPAVIDQILTQFPDSTTARQLRQAGVGQ